MTKENVPPGKGASAEEQYPGVFRAVSESSAISVLSAWERGAAAAANLEILENAVNEESSSEG